MNISDDELSNLCQLIDTEKSQRIKRLINSKDRIRSLVGDILIRNLVNMNLEIKNKEIIFEKNAYGKPYLKGFSNFNFNISHSGDYVICAISDGNVGCDIEEIKPIDFAEISNEFFTNNECKYINYIPNNKLDRFYDIWTLKESYIKCCGQGLLMPLKEFSINIEGYKDIKLLAGENHPCYTHYTLYKYDLYFGYKIAVCLEGKKPQPNIVTIDQKKLIKDFYEICF